MELSIFQQRQRLGNLSGGILCVAMLGFGYILQYGVGLEPCPLCMLQRMAILATGIVFFIAAWHYPGVLGKRVYGVLLLITSGIGVLLAMRHVWLQHFLPEGTELSCGMGWEAMVETFSASEVITTVLAGTGDCAEIEWTLMGLSLPVWTLFGFLVLMAIAVYANFVGATSD